MSAIQSARWLWIMAVVLRLIVLPVTPGDDLWRYRWEGKVQMHGLNPYVLAPDAPALTSLRDEAWGRINHRDFPAIYPPLAEATFAALSAAALPVVGYKVLFALCDLGVVALLSKWLGRTGVSTRAVAWYAWNPLVVYASAGAAHFDVLAVLALIGAVLLLEVSVKSHHGEDVRSWQVSPTSVASVFLLGVSIAIKIVPVVLLPVWGFALGWRRALILLPLAAVVLPASAVFYGFPGVPVFGALRTFASGFHVNDAVWWLVDTWVPAADRAVAGGTYPVLALLVCLGLAIRFRADWCRGMFWVLGAALLLSPALHPWYALWILPFATGRGEAGRPWFILSVSLFGYFLLWEVNRRTGQPWAEPLWLRLLIYLPPLLVWGMDTIGRTLLGATRRQA